MSDKPERPLMTEAEAFAGLESGPEIVLRYELPPASSLGSAVNVAWSYWYRRNYALAERYFREALAFAPADADSLYGLAASLFLQADRYVEALSVLDDLLSRDAAHVRALHLRAVIVDVMNDAMLRGGPMQWRSKSPRE